MQSLIQNKTWAALLFGTACLFGLAPSAHAGLMVERATITGGTVLTSPTVAHPKGTSTPNAGTEHNVNFTFDNNIPMSDGDGDEVGIVPHDSPSTILDTDLGVPHQIIIAPQTIGGLSVGGVAIVSTKAPFFGELTDQVGTISNPATIIVNGKPVPNTTTVEVRVWVGDRGYALPGGGDMNSTVSGTIAGGSVRIITWDDPKTKQFGGQNANAFVVDNSSPTATQGLDDTFTDTAKRTGAFVHLPFIDMTDVTFGPGTYSKTIFYDITLLPGGSLTGLQATIDDFGNVVPEPAAPVLVLTALPILGLGGLWLRRKRSLPTAA